MGLRRRERVFLCRLGFVLLCLLPTVVVAGWVARNSHPKFLAADVQEWQRELSQRTGLAVSIGGLIYPNHYTARLVDVRLADPETAAVAVQVRSLEIARTSSGWQVSASQPEVHLPALAALSGLLHDRLLRSSAGEQAACEFFARELTLRSADRALTLADVRGVREQRKASVQIALDFQLPERAKTEQPARLTLVRNAQQAPALTRWELQTSAAPLPCFLLGDILPAVANLGSGVCFQGTAWCAAEPAGLSGEVAGTLTNVELDRLVTENFPHQLSGLATLQFSPARIAAGRVTDMRGTLQAADGRISASLLVAAQQHLGLHAAAPTGESLPFRQLSLGFQMDQEGLSLTGSGDPTREGVLLASAASVLLEAPPEHRVPAVALISTLVPAGQVQVPATQQTKLLVQTLPTPDLILPQTAARSRAHTPTRLDPSFDASRAVREGDRR